MNEHLQSLKVGDRVKFREERLPYRVIARNDRFMVCTKPFNLKHTVLYTIIDLCLNIRGTENLVFGLGAETKEQCVEMVLRLESGESEISRRNQIPLIYDFIMPKIERDK